MSRENRVQVTLTAKDLLSPQLAQIKHNIESIGGTARASLNLKDVMGLNAGQLGSLRANLASLSGTSGGSGPSGGLMGDVLFGNLGAMGITAAVSMVTQGIQNMIGTVQSAAKTQTLGLAQAGDLSSQLGINFANAKGLVAETRVEISKMAAALPGENSDYNAIFSQISATVAGNHKGDIGGFKSSALDLTKTYGVLASIRGVDANQGGSALNRLLAGTMGVSEAFATNDLLQKNPLLRKYLGEQLKAIGKTEADFKSLTNAQREKLFIASGKQAISKETLDSFDGTVDSMIAIAKTSLFDADTGLFGFLRKLGSAGGRSGLDAVQGTMQTFGLLLGTLGKIGAKYGLSFDPMMGIISTLDWFTDLSNTVNGVLNGEASGKLGKYFVDFNRGIINYLNKGLSKLGELISVADWSAIGKQMGKVLGVGLSDWILGLDWGALAVDALQMIGASIQFQASLVYGAIDGLFANIAKTIQNIPTSVAKSIGIPVDNTSVMAGAKAAGDTSYGVGKELFKLVPGAGALFNLGSQQNDNNNRSRPGSLNGAIVTPGTLDSTQTPLPTIKTEGGSKQVSFNPSFTINAPAGTDTDGLVALIRNTINNDWNEFKANALA